jgi:hypothetical protein
VEDQDKCKFHQTASMEEELIIRSKIVYAFDFDEHFQSVYREAMCPNTKLLR